ncbi:NADH-quinone oxidoreductase subunit J [bacterium]|nr:NADH-quinone oxidoreductase subunit J [bacterium]
MTETEIIKSITFYGFAIFSLLFAILSIISNNVVYSLLYALIVFFSAGGIFFSVGADYNAVVQIAIYGTAIPILFLFAIMFTSFKENKTVNLALSPRFFIAFFSSAFLFMVLWYSAKFAININENISKFFIPKLSQINSFELFSAISKGIYVNYQLAFILFAFMIFVVAVGISVLNIAKEKNRD